MKHPYDTKLFIHNTIRIVRYVIRIVRYVSYNTDNYDASYIEGIKGDIKWDFNGVHYHEMVHVWQWYGQRSFRLAPGELIEEIADYVRLKVNYAPSHWVKPGKE